MAQITLTTIQENDLKEIWEISYGPRADLEWMKYNGPYFKDPVEDWEAFVTGYGKKLVNHSLHKAILVDDRIVGLVTAYWEDGTLQQWLEMGIILYDSTSWGQGIGTVALSKWLRELFDQFDYLPHIGFTTWSGNKGMQKIGENCHMTKEGVIRKVRFWNDHYYDSVKYGILREEFFLNNRK